MQHRRLQILFALISLFAFGVIVWYFLFATPQSAPSLETTATPLSLRDLPARIGFIFQGNPPEQTSETEVTPPGSVPFIKVWDNPAAGNVLVNRPILREVLATTTVGTSTLLQTRTVRATTTVLMFVDRITGHIYGHSIESGATYQISNTTVPGIYDAYIWNGGDRVLFRFLDTDKKTIVSMLATIPQVQEGRDAEPLIDTTYLPQDVSSVAVNRSLSTLSYVVPNDAGSSIYSVNARGTTKIADSPFGEWIISYGGDQLYATPKASAYVKGSTVSLPSFGRLVGEKTGLVTTPSSTGLLLSSMWSQTGLVMFSTNGGTTTILPVKTLASKCTPGIPPYFLCGVPKTIPESYEGLPDDWYQGRVQFNDTLQILNAQNGEVYTLYTFDEKYGSIDVTHIQTTPQADLISFIRKQDGALFLLNTNLFNESTE